MPELIGREVATSGLRPSSRRHPNLFLKSLRLALGVVTDASGGSLGQADIASGSSNNVSDTWQQKGGAFTTPANTASLRVRLYTHMNSGWMAFDDVSLSSNQDDQITSLSYDAENRLAGVSVGGQSFGYVYDGDGRRVAEVSPSGTTVFIGNYFEWSGSTSTMKQYYYASTRRVAVRTGSAVNFLMGDHLGSTSVVTDASGAVAAEMKYKPFGEVRADSGMSETGYTFTGQYSQVDDFGLMFYNARWYDPYLNHWIQPDTIVPDPYNPQDWDRYSYTRNNPINYIDPTGHMVAPDTRENGCSGSGPACIMDMYYAESGDSEGLYDSVEAYIRRNPDYDPAQDPELTGTAPFIVAAAKTRVGMENGSFWDYVAFGLMVGFGTYTTGYAPAELPTGQSGKLSNQHRDIWGDPDCAGCGYTVQALSPQEILIPGGSPVGTTTRRNPQIRTVQDVYELERIFTSLTVNATPINNPSYNGQFYQLPGGGTVGWRNVSMSGGPTIDVNISGVPITKIHLP